MNFKHLAVTAAVVIGIMAVANRVSFTRQLLGGSSVQPWF